MVPKGVLKACCVVDICPLIQYFYFYFVGEPSKVTGVKYVSMEFKGFASHFFFKEIATVQKYKMKVLWIVERQTQLL